MVLVDFLLLSLLNKVKASIPICHSNLISNSIYILQAPDSGFSPLLYCSHPGMMVKFTTHFSVYT